MARFPARIGKAGPYAAIALLGFALVIAGTNADPGPRGARRAQLIDLIEREDERARALRGELDRLQADLEQREIDAVRRGGRLEDLRARIAELASLAGADPVTGPGVRVVLRDSSLRESPTGDPNDLVIHEQDLQAIVNAMWAAGAEAVAINGERITAMSAVRCVGNTLLLHGSVYAPPYRIDAVGEPGLIVDGLRRDPLVSRFEIFAQEFRLGFETRSLPSIRVPEFRGVIASRYASA